MLARWLLMAELADTEAERVWLRLKRAFGDPGHMSRDATRRRAGAEGSKPFGKGRDPKALGDVVGLFTHDMGWSQELARGGVLVAWADIVGEKNAEQTNPVAIEDGTLLVQCRTTAWAQQMRMLRTAIVTELIQRFPDAGIQTIRFIGPDVPSYTRGIRTVRGRGPRDTWG